MSRSTKSYEERLFEMERREQESLEKAKKYAAQKRELQKRQKAEESRKRTHRLCVIGGAVESVLGYPIEEEDIPKLIGFLIPSLLFMKSALIDNQRSSNKFAASGNRSALRLPGSFRRRGFQPDHFMETSL